MLLQGSSPQDDAPALRPCHLIPRHAYLYISLQYSFLCGQFPLQNGFFCFLFSRFSVGGINHLLRRRYIDDWFMVAIVSGRLRLRRPSLHSG